MIANVDCDANRDVCSRFGVGGYPTLKWFPVDSKDSPDAYEGGRTLDDLVDFVNREAGTKRTSSGRLDSTSGVIEDFKSLIESFTSGNRDNVLSEAAALKEKLGSKMAAVYYRAFEKLSEDANYAVNEIQRLQRMVDSGSLQSKKIDEFTQRINILNQFTQ